MRKTVLLRVSLDDTSGIGTAEMVAAPFWNVDVSPPSSVQGNGASKSVTTAKEARSKRRSSTHKVPLPLCSWYDMAKNRTSGDTSSVRPRKPLRGMRTLRHPLLQGAKAA